jgi:hypothetical protein
MVGRQPLGSFTPLTGRRALFLGLFWLVADSLRDDVLDADRATVFNHHSDGAESGGRADALQPGHDFGEKLRGHCIPAG